MADRLESCLEGMKYLLLIEVGELLTEALEVAEGMFVDKAHQTEQLQQGVLQRRGREQQLVLTGQGDLNPIIA